MFGLSDEQEKELRRIIPNIDSFLAQGKKREVLLIIDDAILDTFDEKQDPTENTIDIQRIYDHVYNEWRL